MTTRRRATLLTAVLLVTLAGCAGVDVTPAKAPPAPAPRPAYEVGHRWIRTDGVWEVMHVGDDVYVFRDVHGSELVVNRDLMPVGIVDRSPMARRPGLPYSEPFGFYPAPRLEWPLVLGARGTSKGSWRFTYDEIVTLPNPRNPAYTYSRTYTFTKSVPATFAWAVEAYEQVRVPAGPFDAYRLRFTLTPDERTPEAPTWWMRAWYAPAIRQFVAADGKNIGRLQFRLAAFDPGAPEPLTIVLREPEEGSESARPDVTVTGRVAAASGIASVAVTVNAMEVSRQQPAGAPTELTVERPVALREGRNVIIVTVTDVAGRTRQHARTMFHEPGRQRLSAETERARMMSAREAAARVEAARLASGFWEAAQRTASEAGAAFAARDYVGAAEVFRAASASYERAAAAAGTAARLAAQRAAMERAAEMAGRARAAAEASDASRWAPSAWRDATAADQDARASASTEHFDRAAAAYARAETAYRAAEQQALTLARAAATAERDREELRRRAQEAAERQARADAEAAQRDAARAARAEADRRARVERERTEAEKALAAAKSARDAAERAGVSRLAPAAMALAVAREQEAAEASQRGQHGDAARRAEAARQAWERAATAARVAVAFPVRFVLDVPSQVEQDTVRLTGRVTSPRGLARVSMTLNGATVFRRDEPSPAPDVPVQAPLTLREGDNTIVVTAVDADGRIEQDVRTVRFDRPVPLTLEVRYPLRDERVSHPTTVVAAVASSSRGVTEIKVALNGQEVARHTERRPQRTVVAAEPVTLAAGANTIEVTVVEDGGATRRETRKITLEAPAAVVAAPVAGAAAAPQRWAVVVGIDTYDNPAIPRLQATTADAEAVYRVLTEQGGFKKENVVLITDRTDRKPTLRTLKWALGTFLARSARKGDTVVIFFAGHGAPEADVTGREQDGLAKYLVPTDADPDDLYATGFPMDEFETIFSRIEAERIVVFLDTCYSGAAGGRTFASRRSRALNVDDAFLQRLVQSRGRVIVTASRAAEVSIELRDLGHGLFTYYLVRGLNGEADANADAIVTVQEVYEYVADQVVRHSRTLGANQHPTLKGELEGPLPLLRVRR